MTGYAKTCAVLQIFDTHPQQQLLAALLPVDAVSHGASRTLLLGTSSCGPTLQQLPQPHVCAGHMAQATGTLGPPSRALGEPGSETSPFFPCLEETLLFPGLHGQGRSWPSSRPRVPFPPKPCTPEFLAVGWDRLQRVSAKGLGVVSVPAAACPAPACGHQQDHISPGQGCRTAQGAGRSRSLRSSCSRRSRDP